MSEFAASQVKAQQLFWQQSQWQEVMRRLQSNTMPHALLLSGAAGLGKKQFAESLAHAVLCDHSAQRIQQVPAVQTSEDLQINVPTPCGQCHSCELLKAGSHPDILQISPESKGKSINVEQVRKIAHFLSLKSHLSSHQVVLLEPAENMNHFAANSLLKTLEEPSANSLLLLVSHKPSLLLPTIRSRCQGLSFTAPEPALLSKWLQQHQDWDLERVKSLLFISNGSPLHALEYGKSGVLEVATEVLGDFQALAYRKQEPAAIAKKWLELEIPLVYQWLISWIGTMIQLKSCGPLPDNNPVVVAQLQKLAEQVHLHDLFDYFDKLMECYRLLSTQANMQLLLEDCLIDWHRMHKT